MHREGIHRTSLMGGPNQLRLGHGHGLGLRRGLGWRCTWRASTAAQVLLRAGWIFTMYEFVGTEGHTSAGVRLSADQGLGSKIPPCDSEYPGYLRVLYLIQQGTQSSTPKTSQMGSLFTEAMIWSYAAGRVHECTRTRGHEDTRTGRVPTRRSIGCKDAPAEQSHTVANSIQASLSPPPCSQAHVSVACRAPRRGGY